VFFAFHVPYPVQTQPPQVIQFKYYQQTHNTMAHALTVKGQVTIPKAMREHMGVAAGQALDFEAQADGKVLVFPVKPASDFEAVLNKWMGTGILKMSTEDILRETRGDDCMR
jgi:antitoxin PrlF